VDSAATCTEVRVLVLDVILAALVAQRGMPEVSATPASILAAFQVAGFVPVDPTAAEDPPILAGDSGRR
jgi:hypothetical protein